MNKKQFMNDLRKNLKGLPKEDLEEILEDYEEHFEVGKKKKRKETEIAKALGNPKQIAKHVRLELLVSKAEKKKSVGNIFKMVFATIGLSFFNLVFVVGIFFALISVIISLFAVGFSIAISGVVVIFAGILYPMFSHLIYFSWINQIVVILAGICMASLGILFLIGTWYVGKGFYIITIKYVKFNIKIIKGKEK